MAIVRELQYGGCIIKIDDDCISKDPNENENRRQKAFDVIAEIIYTSFEGCSQEEIDQRVRKGSRLAEEEIIKANNKADNTNI